MRLVTRQLLALLPAAILCGIFCPPMQDPAPSPPGQAPLAIGVLDLDRVSRASKLLADRRKEREAQFTGMQQALNQMEGELTELEGKLEQFDRGSWNYRHAEIDIRAKTAELEAKRRLFTEQLDAELSLLQHEVFDAIQQQLDAIAKKRKLSLVLRWRELPEAGQPQSVRERLQVYSFRDVLWRADPLDITEDVILAMNR